MNNIVESSTHLIASIHAGGGHGGRGAGRALYYLCRLAVSLPTWALVSIGITLMAGFIGAVIHELRQPCEDCGLRNLDCECPAFGKKGKAASHPEGAEPAS